jgi:hypothetical protein
MIFFFWLFLAFAPYERVVEPPRPTRQEVRINREGQICPQPIKKSKFDGVMCID